MNNKKSSVSGIYKIVNKINGKYYLGSSDNILGTAGRWKEHINGLNAGRHENSYLQRAWNKYGECSFEFIIIKKVPKSKLFLVEQKYLDKIKSDRRNLCYNLSFVAVGGGFAGHKHSEKSRKKTSEKLIGRFVSEETRQKMSQSLKGRKPGFGNKTHSEEWKLNNSKRMKEYWAKRKND